MLTHAIKTILTVSLLIAASEPLISLATDSTQVIPPDTTVAVTATRGFVLGTGYFRAKGGDTTDLTLYIKLTNGVPCPSDTKAYIEISAAGTETLEQSKSNIYMFRVRYTGPVKPWDPDNKLYEVPFTDWTKTNNGNGANTDYSWTLYCIPPGFTAWQN